MTTPPEAESPAEKRARAERDLRWMKAAMALGVRGLGRSWPNPAVGCVIVAEDGRGPLVGRGWTQPGGRPHAEAMALAMAGPRAKGAAAYVTLEPCAHHGVTPPCAAALATAGVRRVVCAVEDPDPRVDGRGFEQLRAAGVEVEVGLCRMEAEETHAGYLLRRSRNRPWLTLKLAATLDGRIATATGESQWISGPLARKCAHLLRADHDAILVGSGTAQADDPRLDVRIPGLEATSPVRVVADSRLTLPLDGQLAQTAPALPLWVLHRDDAPAERRVALEALGVVCLPCATDAEGRLSLPSALKLLAERGVTRLMCEGGGGLAASLLSGGLVDRLVVVFAGAAIGADGVPSIAALGLDRLAEAPRFVLRSERRIGPDVLTDWRRA